MASHLSDLGFRFSEENFQEEFVEMIGKYISIASNDICVAGQSYIIVYIDDAIEIWMPADEDNVVNPLDFEIHYNTKRWFDAINPEWVTKEEDETQGMACIWESGERYPMNIRIPNAACVPEFKEGKVYKCQIAGLVESLMHFKTEEEFHTEIEHLDHRAFIPVGQFDLDEDNPGQSPIALINGVVKHIEKKVNGYADGEYYHIVLETYGMDVDLFADPEFVETNIEIGDILSVGAYLTGKIRRRYVGDDLGYLQRLKPGNKAINTLEDLFEVVRECWCSETAYPSCQEDWVPEDPTYGQCAITAMLVHDMFGGSIHRIWVDDNWTHYFNKVDGQYIDLTSEQFDLYNMHVDYEANEEMDYRYCGKNPDTKKRYDFLVKRVAEKVNGNC
jgi:hypothetical protein